MRSNRSVKQLRSSRRGFTLIELLVVISIIATLMALILPAIQSAREAARRTQCQNNLKNITLAAINFAEAHKGVLPASGTYPGTDTDSDGMKDTIRPGFSWVLDLLPYLDQQAVYDRWDFNQAFNLGTNVVVGQYNFEVLTCPNDNSAVGQNGGLTYVANAGVGDHLIDVVALSGLRPAGFGHSFSIEPLSWGSGAPFSPQNVNLTKELGVFWAKLETVAPSPGGAGTLEELTARASANIGQIYDGAGNTMLFTENVNAGANAVTGSKTWADPSIRSCAFLFPVASASGMTFGNLYNYANLSFGSPFINRQKFATDGAAPFPNSRHIGIIVASFCDGTVKALDENIDNSIYVRLITPNGAKLRKITGFVPEDPLKGNDF